MTLMVKCDRCGEMHDPRDFLLRMDLSANVIHTSYTDMYFQYGAREVGEREWTGQVHMCRKCADEFLETVGIAIPWDDKEVGE